MTDPWDWYIYLHEWLIFVVNVGKTFDTSPIDAMGIGKYSVYSPDEYCNIYLYRILPLPFQHLPFLKK